MDFKIDQIIRSKRRTISLEITRDAKLVVHAPMRTPKYFIEEAAAQKRGWILEKQREAAARNEKHLPKACVDGERFELLGKEYTLRFIENAPQIFLQGEYLVVPVRLQQDVQAALIEWYKRQAEKILRERAHFYAERAGVEYTSLKITSALTRWGSCSAGKRLCFTWRLAMAPVDKIDYVVVHELSHIGHPDHSAAFWRRVAELMPDYAPRREWFRQNSALLRHDFFLE